VINLLLTVLHYENRSSVVQPGAVHDLMRVFWGLTFHSEINILDVNMARFYYVVRLYIPLQF